MTISKSIKIQIIHIFLPVSRLIVEFFKYNLSLQMENVVILAVIQRQDVELSVQEYMFWNNKLFK